MTIPAESIITFFTASLFLAIAPGPDNIFVMTQSATRGKTAGLAVVAGLCTGLLVHSSAVAFGLAVIFQTSAIAFTLLKSAGAAYLLWLAWQILRAPADKIIFDSGSDGGFFGLYSRGILMNITNPKVSVFFLAFLPQFADPANGSVTLQILIFGAFFILATILVFSSIALLAGSIGKILVRFEKAQIFMNRLTGMIFIGLALKLAMVRQ